MPFFYNAFVMTPKSLLPAFLDRMTEKISRRPNILYEAVVSLQLVVQTGWLGEIYHLQIITIITVGHSKAVSGSFPKHVSLA